MFLRRHRYLVSESYAEKIKSNFRVRETHKHKWSSERKSTSPRNQALKYFENFYSNVFGCKWPEIRTALLGKQKYIAVVNNFSHASAICKRLENNGALNIRTLFEHEKNEKVSQQFAKNKNLQNCSDMEIHENVQLEKNLNISKTDNHKISAKNSCGHFVSTTRSEICNSQTETPTYERIKNDLRIEEEFDIHFPESLNIYTYNSSSHLSFQNPETSARGVCDYYLMDGGSLLPVLALDLKPNNTFLDMCAAPGGKSLLALQTQYPSVITSNDFSKSRLDRIFSVYKEYVSNFSDGFLRTGKIVISHNDGCLMKNGKYDRILVDAPCTTDRHSLKEDDNNIFKSSRTKERLKLPELQMELLFNALQLVKKGGIVVYSTCTLSPIQNDGVVHMTLKKIFEETGIEIIVKDLSPALLQTRCLYNIVGVGFVKYGHLVLPSECNNFGPTYFCKFQRIK